MQSVAVLGVETSEALPRLSIVARYRYQLHWYLTGTEARCNPIHATWSHASAHQQYERQMSVQAKAEARNPLVMSRPKGRFRRNSGNEYVCCRCVPLAQLIAHASLRHRIEIHFGFYPNGFGFMVCDDGYDSRVGQMHASGNNGHLAGCNFHGNDR